MVSQGTRGKLKIIYRTNAMLPLLNVISHEGFWGKYGLDVSLTCMSDTIDAEESLLKGDFHVIFGNHTSPYGRYMRGNNLVYIASTTNSEEKYLITSPQITSLKALDGKRFLFSSEMGMHPELSDRYYLQSVGIDLEKSGLIKVYGINNEAERLNKLAAGDADMTLVWPPGDILAIRRKLSVVRVLSSETITLVVVLTTSDFLRENEDWVMKLLKALAHGICYFKTYRRETLEIMGSSLPTMAGDKELVEHLYECRSARLEKTMYPTAAAIDSVFQMAVSGDAELKGFNPLMVWDLHYVRILNESGFINSLYQR